MKLTAPKASTWWVALALGILGILMYLGYVKIPALAGYTFWVEVAAFGLLALSGPIKSL